MEENINKRRKKWRIPKSKGHPDLLKSLDGRIITSKFQGEKYTSSTQSSRARMKYQPFRYTTKKDNIVKLNFLKRRISINTNNNTPISNSLPPPLSSSSSSSFSSSSSNIDSKSNPETVSRFRRRKSKNSFLFSSTTESWERKKRSKQQELENERKKTQIETFVDTLRFSSPNPNDSPISKIKMKNKNKKIRKKFQYYNSKLNSPTHQKSKTLKKRPHSSSVKVYNLDNNNNNKNIYELRSSPYEIIYEIHQTTNFPTSQNQNSENNNKLIIRKKKKEILKLSPSSKIIFLVPSTLRCINININIPGENLPVFENNSRKGNKKKISLGTLLSSKKHVIRETTKLLEQLRNEYNFQVKLKIIDSPTHKFLKKLKMNKLRPKNSLCIILIHEFLEFFGIDSSSFSSFCNNNNNEKEYPRLFVICENPEFLKKKLGKKIISLSSKHQKQIFLESNNNFEKTIPVIHISEHIDFPEDEIFNYNNYVNININKQRDSNINIMNNNKLEKKMEEGDSKKPTTERKLKKKRKGDFNFCCSTDDGDDILSKFSSGSFKIKNKKNMCLEFLRLKNLESKIFGSLKKIRFWGENDPFFQFSNFYRGSSFDSSFFVDGLLFNSGEGFYQSSKFEKGTRIREHIRKLRNISEIRNYVDRNEIFRIRNWGDMRDRIMKIGLFHKFSQNLKLKKILCMTNDSCRIVQVTPFFENESRWSINKYGIGNNKLGKFLEVLRQLFKSNEKNIKKLFLKFEHEYINNNLKEVGKRRDSI